MEVVLDHLPAQDDFYNSTSREAAYVGGLGTGKTHVGSDWLLTGVVNYPKIPHHIFSNTYDQLVSGTLTTFFERCDSWGISYIPRVRDLHRVFFPRLNAEVQVRSVDKPIQWKSLEISRVWVDEAQAWGKDAYDKVLGRLRGSATQRRFYPEMALRLRITANPPHTMDHWLVDLTTKPDPKTGIPPIELFTAATYDNPFLPQAYIESMEAQFDPEVAEAELRGKFIELGKGRIWRRFNRSKHFLTPAQALARGLPALRYDPTIQISWGHDFNIDPMSSVIFQWRFVNVAGYQQIVMYVLDVIKARTSLVDDVVKEFCENKPEAFKIAKRMGLHLYGDASGNNNNRQTGVSDWAALRTGLKSYGLSGETYLPTNEHGEPGANPPLRDRFAAGNRMLENARGEVGCIMNADTCMPLAIDMERMYYKPGTLLVAVPSQKDGEAAKLIGHLADGWSYPIHFRFPVIEQ
jgi:hypothetical protein